MYKINYFKDNVKKDMTYEIAYITACNNNNQKEIQRYFILKEKDEVCFDIENIVIDSKDVKQMKYDAFSNGILLAFYEECKKKRLLDNDTITIENDTIFHEEVIYNIIKADWLINEKDINPYNEEIKGRENYFKCQIKVSSDIKDPKIIYRNLLYDYFLQSYNEAKEKRENQLYGDLFIKQKTLKK